LTESEGLSHDRHDLLSLIIENLWMIVPRILVLLVSIGTALWVFLIVRQVIVDRNLDVIEDRICLQHLRSSDPEHGSMLILIRSQSLKR
jgi:uncharacterized membrane protein YdjX (TVP38/TMEM64 family)